MVIITGGIDLSVGSSFALLGVLLSIMLTAWHLPWPLAVVLVLGARRARSARSMGCSSRASACSPSSSPSAACFSTAVWRGSSPTTRRRGSATRRDSRLCSGWPPAASSACRRRSSRCVVIGAVMWVVLHRSVYGRHLFATGRNEVAARYSGIRTRSRHRESPTSILGVLTGLSAIIFAFYTNSVSPSSHGNFFELYGIAAAVLGGCSLRGGEGSVIGILLGATLLQVLQNLVNLLGIPSSLNFAVMGGVILVGVVGDRVLQRAGRRASPPSSGRQEETDMSTRRRAVATDLCGRRSCWRGAARQDPTTRTLAFVTNNATGLLDDRAKGRGEGRRRTAGRHDRVPPGRRHGRRAETHRGRSAGQGRRWHRHQPGGSGQPDGHAERRGAARRRVHARQRRARFEQARVLRRHRQRGGRPAGRRPDQGRPCPQGGKIALFVGKLDARNAQERLQGIKEAIAGTNDRDPRRSHGRHRPGAGESERLGNARRPRRRRRARRPLELQRPGDSQRRARRRTRSAR